MSPWNVSFVADLIVRDLERLDEDALKLVRAMRPNLHPGAMAVRIAGATDSNPTTKARGPRCFSKTSARNATFSSFATLLENIGKW